MELSKVLENLSRDINIAMVNEFAELCEELDLDIHHIIDLANSHKRVNLLRPGPGVGGFCIPNAYYYLVPKARETGVDLKLSTTARKTNDHRPLRVVKCLERKLLESGKKLSNCKIAVLGLAMKDYSSDYRQSPAIDVVKLLNDKAKEVSCYDPEISRGIIQGQVNSLSDCVKGANALVFLTRQKEFDDLNYRVMRDEMISNPHPPFVIDTKGALSRNKVTEAGLQYVIM